MDTAPQNRVFGHHAHVLTNMDILKQIFYEVLIERECYAFNVEVQYERLPPFFFHCHMIGHNIFHL